MSFWDWDLLWDWDLSWDSSGSSPKSNLGRRDVFAAASGVGLLGALPPAIAKDCDCHYMRWWVRYDDDGVTDTEQTMIERCGECASVGDSSRYWLVMPCLSANVKPISVKINPEVFRYHSNNVDTDSIQ